MQTGAPTGDLLEQVLDALPDPVLLVDGDLRVTSANAAAQRLLDRPSDALAGRAVAGLLAAHDGEAVEDAWRRLVRPGSAWQRDAALDLLGVRGTPVVVHLSSLPDTTGAAGGVVTLKPRPEQPPLPASSGLAADLAGAMSGDQLVLHYQPVVRLSDRRPVACEALVRWDHPQRGLLEPAQFLALVDSPSLAVRLGERVLRLACHAAHGWSGSWPGLQVTVNLSERQLLQPGTVTVVREALAVAACPPDRLVLEVPETALVHDPESALSALLALKQLGVDVAVDDLGTGSSSLSYLRRFPIDVVKVDRSLVAGLGNDPEDGAVVAALISLADAMGVRCVAEGVETADQLALLRRLGCRLGQGHLFSRPLTLTSASGWLARALAPAVPRSGGARLPAETVERALQLQAEGASLHTIAARLNAEGHRNTGGRRFHHTAIAQLITESRFPGVDV